LQHIAAQHGVRVERAATLNDSDALIEALLALVRAHRPADEGAIGDLAS
jgi:protoheme ferro-lyase